MRMRKGILRSVVICVAAYLALSAVFAQQIVIRDGARRTSLSARVLEGNSYYRVVELASALQFRMSEKGNSLEIIGDRGSLSIIQGRPLVRSGSQYILLSAPAVKLRSTGWWVPVDFIEKGLPNILSRKLVNTGGNVYRVESLNENLIKVETVDYPDHVSVVFRAGKQVSPSVREFNDFIEIRFDRYIVDLDDIESPSTIDVISDITFDPTDGLGTFRVNKGPRFGRYREYVLTNPPRVVIDFFEKPGSRRQVENQVPGRPPVPDTGRPESVPGDVPGMQPPEESALEEVVVIDPGHGGIDTGAESMSGNVEKNLTLAIARQVEKLLQNRGIKTRITRNRDVYLTPDQRSSAANFFTTRAFISLHIGSSPSSATQGPVVYFQQVAESPEENPEESSDGQDNQLMIPWKEGQKPWAGESRRLAISLQSALNRLFLSNNNYMEAPVSLLEPITAPAVLIETGFLTNEADREFLLSPISQAEIARLIADGIEAFLR